MYFKKLIFLLLIAVSALFSGELLSVQVKQTYLRSKPSFLGRSVSKVVYAQQVEDIKGKNGWDYVKNIKNGVKGWVHNSALTKKTIVLNSSEKLTDSSVTQSEVLMAGKGFSKEVESEYKKQNSKLNFSLVDKIEKNDNVSRTKVIRFANNGKLHI